MSKYTNPDVFIQRHNGPDGTDVQEMLKTVKTASVDELIKKVIPEKIRINKKLTLPGPVTETEALAELKEIASRNMVWRSYIGQGYYNAVMPPVIQRTILENPGWYTAYTPYQAEISQGRLEALINFQTMVMELTGMEIANASLLDEGTAAAEAMSMAHNISKNKKAKRFFVSENCFTQTIEVIKTRAGFIGVELVVGDEASFTPDDSWFGAVLQYPDSRGEISDYTSFITKARENNVIVTVIADLLALTLLTPPGEMGADIVVGTTQRFGLPVGFGGPHSAYFATKDDYKRNMPGRLIGISKDTHGHAAYRMSLQTREQHIRRDKATSNICTSQVLLAVLSSMYAVYHGPARLKAIAEQIHLKASALSASLKKSGLKVLNKTFFDTIVVEAGEQELLAIQQRAIKSEINLFYSGNRVSISIDQTVSEKDLADIVSVMTGNSEVENPAMSIPAELKRITPFLIHPVFNRFHTETEILRYIKRLESKDLTLTASMIPLGSCTMKLNAAAEMYPVSWPEFASIHPFVPVNQARGYHKMIHDLENWLGEITGFDAVSVQPNAGSQGEYAGLLAIRDYFVSRKEERDVCLIPVSAHGTNPASAVMAGFRVVAVACDTNGNVDVDDLEKKAAEHKNALAAIMITYPSTHGVFEEDIIRICDIVHANGGQVYMDGANMNAQVGLCRPAEFGADVCHLNLHKTFSIPHGGGGPGVGPICVKEHLKPYLPGHAVADNGTGRLDGAVSAAPYGSAGVLPISWMYIRMTGEPGLTEASRMAILNANYIAGRLEKYFPVLYKGKNGYVAHECILDFRSLKQTAGIEVEDIAKRLMDYGFHAPTMSWPVAGTLMVEPTESESLFELNRFCTALTEIHNEIQEIIKDGRNPDNVLKNAPHTAMAVSADNWEHGYPREKAAYPVSSLREFKFWPAVGRVDNVYGDRNLVCSCQDVEFYAKDK